MMKRALLAAAVASASAAALPPLGPLPAVIPASNLSLGLRHCNYIASATPYDGSDDDFRFVVLAALNGDANSVSFQSVNYPTYYLAIHDQTTGSVGVVAAPDVNDASWVAVNGLVPPPQGVSASYSFQSGSKGAWAGKYLQLAHTNTLASCTYAPPSGDVVLSDGGEADHATWLFGPLPQLPVAVQVNTAAVVNPAVSRRWMGCHHDYGFAQAPRGFFSEMVYGTHFDAGTESVPSWTYNQVNVNGATFNFDTSSSFNAKGSLNMNMPNNAGVNPQAGAVNRGIGGSGFALQAGQAYQVELYIWTGADVTAFVELRDFTANTSLARVDFTATSTGPAWGSTWIHYNFTLTPVAGTSCETIAWDSDPTISCGGNEGDAYVCQRCGGELFVGLSAPGSANFGYVSLMPGAWGRLHAADGSLLPVLQSGADLLTTMGVTIIRSGGSVSQSMRWKDWRGPTAYRPSAGAVWGRSLTAGWGPFEVIDMCNALGIEPMVTFAYDTNRPDDWADLVEYAWGDATTTAWGRTRAADGHPAPYNVTVFELGNEQYTPFFVDSVAAMEARAAAVGAPPLRYMFPNNGGMNAADAQRAVSLGLPIDRILPDLHVGAGGAVEAAAALFASPPVPGFNQGAFNGETNAATHHMTRALEDAADLIDFFTADPNVTGRIFARTASFCTGMATHFDSWDQGISFFLPNMTWLQPPGYVHAMITQTWAETTVGATFTSGTTIPFAAQVTADGKSLVLRAVNANAGPQAISITVQGSTFAGPSYTLWTLTGPSGDADNTPAAPTAIAPVQATPAAPAGSNTINATLPALTFAVMVVPLQ